LAAQGGHLRVVEYLINQKADINAKDNWNKTPLGSSWNSKVVEYLKSKGGQ